jgi:hypothetical protein
VTEGDLPMGIGSSFSPRAREVVNLSNHRHAG